MDRRSILASLERHASFAVVIGVSLVGGAIGCAGTGPAIIEHPRSSSMTFVSPERDPLAGAYTFRVGAPDDTASVPTPPRPRTVATRAPLHAATHARPTIRVADWSLSLGTDETRETVAPEVAFSAAMSMSAGPAPHLAHAAHATVVVPIPTIAVEEGAWEQRRR